MKMRLIMVNTSFYFTSETVVRKCSVREVFLEISPNSQENACVRVSFLIKLQASGGCFCHLLKCFDILYGNIIYKMQIEMSNFIQVSASLCIYRDFKILIFRIF